MHLEALFTHDPHERIRSINEPDGGPAPRFFIGRTAEGNLWRFRHDLPPGTIGRLEEAAAAEEVSGDLRSSPRNLQVFVDALRADGELPAIESGPAYAFPDALPDPGDVTRITGSSLHQLHQMGPGWEDMARGFEAREPCLAVVEDGFAVSVCFSSRVTHRAAEAGLETRAEFRRRGHAVSVVAAWALAVRATGRVPLYSTTWENRASQGVARSLGLIQYGVDLSLK